FYEHRKHTGEIPIVGVNTFQDPDSMSLSADEADAFNLDVTRSDNEEKEMVIARNSEFKKMHSKKAELGLERLKETAREGGNLFEVMMEIVEHCTVGQVTEALFETGGQFRRNM
ncbi:MAG: methylmalonyl-CoA mutase, partial [Euryarchaeota archaeon]|nr:methylmalonyl-CoA mutase [Euryarchaeota archaeon]